MVTSDKLLPIHKRFDIAFSHGEGVYLYSEGRKYLDFGAGIAVNALGHCHEKMVAAITAQAQKLWHVSNIYNGNELNDYAQKLVANCCADYVFFCNSGAEAVECAIKMIRRHFYKKNKPEKYRVITFKGAFHGRTLGTISAAAKEKYLEGFRPALDGFDNVEFGDIAAVRAAVNEHTAGILIEPIQGEEGIRVAGTEFLQQLRDLCDENDLLLAFDEVQCGMGRLGHLNAHKYFGVEPDIVALAKAIGGGFPLGACLAKKNAASGMDYGTHGTTYGGNPLAMAVGKAVLEVMTEDGFFEKVRQNAQLLRSELNQLKAKYPDLIEEIRGAGMMLGIKLTSGLENLDFVSKLIDNGFLAVAAGENVVRLLPPLIIEPFHIKEAIEKITQTLEKSGIDEVLSGVDVF